MRNIKKEISSKIIITWDFSTLLISMNRLSRKKIKKKIGLK